MKHLRACQYYNNITFVFKKFHLFTALCISAWLMKLNECNAHIIPINRYEFHSKGSTKTQVPPCYSLYTICKQPQNVPVEERTPSEYMVDLTNDLAYRMMHQHSVFNRNSFAFSPTALMSVLIAVYEGSNWESMMELINVLGLPNNPDIIRIGYRDINRRLRTYFFNLDNPLKGLSLSKENITITRTYEAILMFYGYDLGSDMTSSTTVPPSTTKAATSTLQTQHCTTTVKTVMGEDTAKSQEIENTITPATTATQTTVNRNLDTTTEISTATNIATEMVTSYNTTEENLTTTENVNDETPVESTTQEPDANGTSPVTEMTEIFSTAGPATKASESEYETETTESEPATETTKSETGTETAESETRTETTESEPATETTESETATETIDSGSATETTESIKSADLIELFASRENAEPFARIQKKERVNRRPSAKLQAPLTSNIKPQYLPVKRKSNHSPHRSKRHFSSSDDFGQLYITPLGNDCRSTNPYTQQSNICNTETDPNPLSKTSLTYNHFQRDYTTIISDMFYLTNQNTVQANFKVYNAVLYYKYFEYLRATVLELELDTPKYNLMIFLPWYNEDLITAAASLRNGPNLRLMRKQLKPTFVRAIIPDFKLEGKIFLTNDLQNMGVVNIFEPNPDHFGRMTHDEGVYVNHIQQSINVHIRTNAINQLTPNNGAQTQPISIVVNYPFMFFIIDRDLDVAVMAGRVLNPLNTRIQ